MYICYTHLDIVVLSDLSFLGGLGGGTRNQNGICVRAQLFWKSWQIFTKFGMNVTPLEATPNTYF